MGNPNWAYANPPQVAGPALGFKIIAGRILGLTLSFTFVFALALRPWPLVSSLALLLSFEALQLLHSIT
jgi:hypothetical protein